jgi:hypothetical protein
LLIVKVTDVEPSAYCEVAAAVAMTVQTPFPPTTMVLSPSTRQYDVFGDPTEYVMAPFPDVVALVDGVNSRPP